MVSFCVSPVNTVPRALRSLSSSLESLTHGTEEGRGSRSLPTSSLPGKHNLAAERAEDLPIPALNDKCERLPASWENLQGLGCGIPL